VSRGQRGGSPTAVNLSFLDRDVTHIHTYIMTVLKHKALKVQLVFPVVPECFPDCFRAQMSDTSAVLSISSGAIVQLPATEAESSQRQFV
jgi:hypothetical protein